MILINAGTPIQPDGLCNEPGVNEVLLTYLAGMEGGLAAADILCGDVNPSGQPDIDISDTGCFGGLERLQWPRIPCSDGPAGLRTKPQCEIKMTARPCEALLASTWDCALIEKIGEAGAGEFRENNIGIWMAPGMNIHRSACCGRNFEYYSEDPLLAGRMAAAMVDGSRPCRISRKRPGLVQRCFWTIRCTGRRGRSCPRSLPDSAQNWFCLALCQQAQREQFLLDLKTILQTELQNSSYPQTISRPQPAGSVDDDVLGFLRALQEEGKECQTISQIF